MQLTIKKLQIKLRQGFQTDERLSIKIKYGANQPLHVPYTIKGGTFIERTKQLRRTSNFISSRPQSKDSNEDHGSPLNCSIHLLSEFGHRLTVSVCLQ